MAFDVVLTPDFKRELKHIAKKHKNILKDLSLLINELISNHTIGTDLGQNIYKIRLAISGTNKGKSGGARVITYVYIEGGTIYLSEIYLKSEHDTVDIKSVIERLHNEGFI